MTFFCGGQFDLKGSKITLSHAVNPTFQEKDKNGKTFSLSILFDKYDMILPRCISSYINDDEPTFENLHTFSKNKVGVSLSKIKIMFLVKGNVKYIPSTAKSSKYSNSPPHIKKNEIVQNTNFVNVILAF